MSNSRNVRTQHMNTPSLHYLLYILAMLAGLHTLQIEVSTRAVNGSSNRLWYVQTLAPGAHTLYITEHYSGGYLGRVSHLAKQLVLQDSTTVMWGVF